MAGVGFVRPRTPRQMAEALWVAMEPEPDSIKGQDARDRLQVCLHHPHAHHHHPHLHLNFFVQTAAALEREVTKGVNKKGVAALAVIVKTNSKRDMAAINWVMSLQTLPVSKWKKAHKEACTSLESAIKLEQLMVQSLRHCKQQVDPFGDLTPEFPIMQMNLDEVSEYLPRLHRRLIKIEGSKGTMWMSKTGKPPGNDIYTPIIVLCLL